MGKLRTVWNHVEEIVIIISLALMTLVTFFYVLFNNVYEVFFSLADKTEQSMPWFSSAMAWVGEHLLDLAMAMTWSNALTKLSFAWLIFFGLAYGVRTAGHIGVDIVLNFLSPVLKKWVGVLACMTCLGYALLLSIASYEWVSTLFVAAVGAEDLSVFGIQQWHIALVVPVGFGLVVIRYLEIFVRILRNQQVGLGLADEAADALNIAEPQKAEERA